MSKIVFENSKDLSDLIRGFIDKYTEETIKCGAIDSYITALRNKLKTATENNEDNLELLKINITSMIEQLESIKTLIDIGKTETMANFEKIDFEKIMSR